MGVRDAIDRLPRSPLAVIAAVSGRLEAVVSPRRVPVIAWFCVVAAAVFFPYLGDGYILTLDMVLGPDTDFLDAVFHRKGALFYGRLLPAAVFDTISAVGVPVWVIQQVVLVTIIVSSGVAGYSAATECSVAARIAGGTLYALNPFTYARLIAGHWWILASYAALPVALRRFYDLIAGRRDTRRDYAVTVALITVIAAFGPHVLYLFCVGAGVITGVVIGHAIRRDQSPTAVLTRTARLTGVTGVLNAYWIVPAGWVLLNGQSRTAAFTTSQLEAFETSRVIVGDALFTTAYLHGFWRAGFRELPVVRGDTLTIALFAPVLILVVLGATAPADRARPWRRACLLIAGIGIALGAGYASPLTRPIFVSLYTSLPGFAGFRESQKFVALTAASYAILLPYGIDDFSSGVRSSLPASVGSDVSPRRLARRTTTAVSVVVLVVLVLFSGPMIGLSGQVTATHYPDTWHSVDRTLEERVGESDRVLFLPYHQYMRFPWVGRDVVPPAQHIFPNTIRGRNIELRGAVTRPRDPTHRHLRPLVYAHVFREQAPDTSFGAAASEVGVRYIVLAKAGDYGRYSFLDEDESVVRIRTTEDLLVYRVTEPAPEPPTGWPRDGARRPLRALGVGIAVSVGAMGLLVTRWVRTRAGYSDP